MHCRMPKSEEQMSSEVEGERAREQQAWLWSTAPASMQPQRDAQGLMPAAKPMLAGDLPRTTKLKADLLRASLMLPSEALLAQVCTLLHRG